MLYSASLIRCYIVKAIKKNERVVNKIWLKCGKWESQYVKRNNSNCLRGTLLSRLRLNMLPNSCVSSHLLTVPLPHAVTTSVRHFTTTRESRSTSRTLSATELKKSIEHLTDQFMEARELLDDARESVGTVYFSDDMNEARAAVIMTLEEYQSLLNQLSEDQKQEVLRTIGLKMEELKAQEQSIKDSLKDE